MRRGKLESFQLEWLEGKATQRGTRRVSLEEALLTARGWKILEKVKGSLRLET